MSAVIPTAAVALCLLLTLPATASAPSVVPLAEGVAVEEHGSNAARKYGYPGAALVLPAGEIRGMRDIQLGFWDPERPSMLNGDVGAGNAQNPGVLNLGADVSRAVRIQAEGRTLLTVARGCVHIGPPKHRIASFCPHRPIVFHRKVVTR